MKIITLIYFFLLQWLHVFFLLYSLCKYLQGPSKDDRLIIRPFDMNSYIYNIIHFFWFIKLKAVPQRPFHDTVPRKYSANWQGNTSRRSVIPAKLLLCNFIETKPWRGCSPENSPHIPQNTQLGGVASDVFTTRSSNMLETYALCDTNQ